MNGYRLGIGVYPGGVSYDLVGEIVGADAVTEEAWTKANAELQGELTKVARGFPKSFDALKAAQMLEAAVLYGQKMRGKYGGWTAVIPGLAWITPGYTPSLTGLQQAINKADDESKKWRSKVHPGIIVKPYVYNQGANKEWKEVQSQVLRVYVEAAGLVGQRLKVDEARRELADNLNPIAPTNLWRIGIVVATVAAAGGYLLSKGHR